jgi:methylase of polypeptide subunit release factors
MEEPPAAIALEVGAGQAGTIAELVRRAGYDPVETRPDLAGIERVVLGR